MNILITTSSFNVNSFPKELNIIHNPYKRRLTEEEVKQLIIKYQPVGIIAGLEPLTRDVLLTAKNLKIISRCGIGVDNVDLNAAREMNIKVTNTPDAPTVSVAELTLGLILTLARHINLHDTTIRGGGWKGPKGILLKDKTVGIIGCGRIGTYVAKLLSAFGCKILGHDPYIQKHNICNMVSFETIIKEADIITLHVPFSKETRQMISSRELKQMKKTALLINAARGGIVDEEALYNALKSGEISGAALDCFEEEPYNGPLKELDNTVLTAHMGSSAKEARVLMEKHAVDNLVKELTNLAILKA